MSRRAGTYAVIDLDLLGVIAFDCPGCGHRNACMLEQGKPGLVECRPPPESPRGSRAAAILPPNSVACASCRRQFRAVAARAHPD